MHPATAATSKGKSTFAGGAGPTDTHPPNPDVLIEDVREGQSSPPTPPEAGTNGHETQLLAKGQLLQMLASLQRQLDEQRMEAAREPEEAPLKIDASN